MEVSSKNKEKILSKCASLGKTSKVYGIVDGQSPHIVHIGEYVVVGGGSLIITHGPVRLYYEDPSIHIEDLVWIGFHCYILPGVRLGRGSLIGTASVVTHSTEPFSIYGGNPAKFIKNREDKEIIRSFVVRWLMNEVLGNIQENNINWRLLKERHIDYLFPDGRYNGMSPKQVLKKVGLK